MKNYVLLVLIYLTIQNCFSQEKTELSVFPKNFSDKCCAHIEELAGYGIRTANLESESKTINYITKEFRKTGVKVSVDTFYYKYFNYDSAVVLYNNQRIDFSRLFINPYENVTEIESDIYILNSPIDNLKHDLSNKIIVADETCNFFDLFKINAKAIIVVNENIMRSTIVTKSVHKMSLKLFGKIKEYKSYNIIGNPLFDKKKEILISAHWDSKIGPGADDNASGISVMLELAKYFQQNKNSIPFNIRYVAFGAEEMGMLGAQAYLRKHSNDLKNSILNVNIDGVGGDRDVMIEVHKSSKDDIETFQNLLLTVGLCSGHAENHSWIMISPVFYETTLFTSNDNVDWIDEGLEKAAKKTGIDYNRGLSDGDHRIIALSGVPVIGINVLGNRYHVVEDIPATINKSSLEKVGKLIAEFINNIE